MKKKELVKLGSSQYELFRLHYLQAVAAGEQESIHQMRVALKRFFALKRYLLHDMDPYAAAMITNYLEPLHLVYKAAGKVRDLQVLRDATVDSFNLKTPDKFGNYLQSLQESRFEKFIAISKTVDLPAQRDMTLSLNDYVRRCYKDKDSRLEHLIGKHLNEARFYLESTQPGELWHQARTLIKQNYLLMQLAVEHHPHRFSSGTIQQYRDMEQVLGRWHDYSVLKKYALRFESTRALNIDGYIQQIDLAVGSMERTIKEAISAFGG